ncbi:hypothetical protein BKA56DRAFT_144850 [Ilyonectria sp. MPI-CAGE-AT-0026]|nr:hypothetical protein BKA56DRAFT_144850 [Ilyonectria sp. MPI-CAGE-AT-0026]
MPPPRKPHRKSRYGCIQCKRRHVKCDEEKPCRRCLDREEQCSLKPDVAAADITRPDKRLSVPTVSNRISSHQRRLNELFMMHHYATETCDTLVDSLESVEVFKRVVPREAMKFGFLMDGLLALASLHLAFLDQSMKEHYTEVAIQYQNSGLNAFKEALDSISEESATAVFAFSIVTTILAFAMPGNSSGHQVSNVSDTFVSICQLLRGVRTIVFASEISIRTGPLGALADPTSNSSASNSPSPPSLKRDGIQAAMAELREQTGAVGKYSTPKSHQAYLSGIKSLETSFDMVTQGPKVAVVAGWPVEVTDELVELFRRGDPIAILICIHYGALALEIHDRWWGKNFGIDLIDELSQSLHSIDAEWASHTEWARTLSASVANNVTCSL